MYAFNARQGLIVKWTNGRKVSEFTFEPSKPAKPPGIRPLQNSFCLARPSARHRPPGIARPARKG